MIKSASEIRSAARTTLSGHWTEAAMLTFVYCIVAWAFSALVGGLEYVQQGLGTVASLLLLPLGWGYAVTFLSNARGEEDPFNVSRMFDGYRDFVRIFTTILLTQIYILLWTLLLIIPGIIKSLSYAMTPFVLRDNPEMKNNAAIELSMKLMDGHKGELFWLYLTFIGWGILCILTLGIGYFWLAPYMQASMAQFYEEVKAEYEQYDPKRER
ncbi:MAG: DUF975 family protein [Bacteroidaceae bacterium]|nr:DUF975 family protein [Bacteroidaceae bacterium]